MRVEPDGSASNDEKVGLELEGDIVGGPEGESTLSAFLFQWVSLSSFIRPHYVKLKTSSSLFKHDGSSLFPSYERPPLSASYSLVTCLLFLAASVLE